MNCKTNSLSHASPQNRFQMFQRSLLQRINSSHLFVAIANLSRVVLEYFLNLNQFLLLIQNLVLKLTRVVLELQAATKVGGVIGLVRALYRLLERLRLVQCRRCGTDHIIHRRR